MSFSIIKNLEYRLNAWRGSIAVEIKCPFWFNDLDMEGEGWPRLVALAASDRVEEIEGVEDIVSSVLAVSDIIRKFICNYFSLSENLKKKAFCIEAVLVPISKKYVILEVLPLTEEFHHGIGVVVDVEACRLRSFDESRDLGIVSTKEGANLWAQNLSDWRDFDKVKISPIRFGEDSIESFPEINDDLAVKILKSYKKTSYGYVHSFTTSLFSDEHREVEVRVSDGFEDTFKPRKVHAESIVWLQKNEIKIQADTFEELRRDLGFNGSELASLELTEIVQFTNPLHKTTLIFKSDKFDYDEHGLGVIWSKGKIASCGYAY